MAFELCAIDNLVLFLFSAEDNELMIRTCQTKHSFPLDVSPSPISLGQEKSAAF